MHPVHPEVDVVRSLSFLAMNSLRSASQALVRRVIAAGDRPASLPKNSASAGRKSPEDNPCR